MYIGNREKKILSLRDSITQESPLFPRIRQQSMYLIKDNTESKEVQTASVNKPGICTTRKTEASVKEEVKCINE